MKVDQINILLKKICHELSGGQWFGQGSFNYVVDAEIFHEKASPNLIEAALIKKLLPNSVVGDIEESDLSELIDIVNECFGFIGDEGSYPNKKYLLSKEFKDDLNNLLEEMKILFSSNLGISKFWLKEGHPFYPVYWDYAFLVRKTDDYFVLIASSSD